mgnify:CR=1 FL=1
MTTLQRLFDPRLAFEHPVTVGVTAVCVPIIHPVSRDGAIIERASLPGCVRV